MDNIDTGNCTISELKADLDKQDKMFKVLKAGLDKQEENIKKFIADLDDMKNNIQNSIENDKKERIKRREKYIINSSSKP